MLLLTMVMKGFWDFWLRRRSLTYLDSDPCADLVLPEHVERAIMKRRTDIPHTAALPHRYRDIVKCAPLAPHYAILACMPLLWGALQFSHGSLAKPCLEIAAGGVRAPALQRVLVELA
jgi:hypothetical protein